MAVFAERLLQMNKITKPKSIILEIQNGEFKQTCVTKEPYDIDYDNLDIVAKTRSVYGYDPVVAEETKVLIVGTIPSIAGYRKGFYYLSIYSDFWKILTDALKKIGRDADFSELKKEYNSKETKEERLPEIIDDIKQLLNDNGISLMDSLEYCVRVNGYDSGILAKKYLDEDVLANELSRIKPKKILFTSKEAKDDFFKTKDGKKSESFCKKWKGICDTLESPSKTNNKSIETKTDMYYEKLKDLYQ